MKKAVCLLLAVVLCLSLAACGSPKDYVLTEDTFFLVMTNVLNGAGNHMKFLTPHYPVNGSVLHFGVSWPFFN